jgi:hypothetical protein
MPFVQPSARQADDGSHPLTDDHRAIADQSGYYNPDSAAYDEDLGDVEGHAGVDSTDDVITERELVTV